MIPIAKPAIGEEEKKAVLEVLESGMLAQGEKVKELEKRFAAYCGAKHAVAASSGTAALHMGLYSTGIKEGDEVITTPFTFVSTANSIIMQGARPVFVDINPKTFNIDPEKIEEAVTKKTKAIIPVDLYGQPYDYDAVRRIADKHNLMLIEDACQAVGAELNGNKVGKLGTISAFSLYATKNIVAGEGGIITTDDEKIAEMARRFRHHGQSEKTRYEYHDLGYNYRMTDMQAAIGLEQLKKVDSLNSKRIENAGILTEGLKGIKGIKTPTVGAGTKHVFHQYTIRVDGFKLSRDQLVEELKDKGIGCAVFYPKPLHMHPHFARFGYKKGDFPMSEEAAEQVLSLPVHPSVSKDDVKEIIRAFEEISNGQ